MSRSTGGWLSPKKNASLKPRAFTLMFVPHSGNKSRGVRVPTWLPQVLLVGLIAVIAGLGWLGLDYLKLREDQIELLELRHENKLQAERVEELAEEALAVQERLQEIDELDLQVRELMGLPTREPDELSYRAGTEVASRGGPGRPVTAAAVRDSFRGSDDQIDCACETLEQLKKEVLAERERLAHVPSGWPLRGTVTSKFGVRRSPYGRSAEFHSGMDISAPRGTAIRATGAGQVTFAGWYGGYGYMIVIDHGYGFSTAYAHNSKHNVSVGKQVERGDIIAYVGSTGRSTGPHLHYEVRRYGEKIDPAPYL